MKSPLEAAACAVNVGILRAASLFVPACQRVEWRSEWRGELWQVRSQSSSKFSWTREREIAGFCVGAFSDAFCLRRIDRHVSAAHSSQTRSLPVRAFSVESAWQCLLFMVALVGASYGLARFLPGVRAERSLPEVPVRSGLVLIENANNEDSPPTISSGQFEAWRERKQEFFDGFAFYRVTRERVNLGPVSKGWGVASASSNFFALMGLPVRFRQPDASVDADLPSVILSEDLWKREFGADPHVAGSVVRLGLRRATIAGVAPVTAWQLPGKVDAWLFEPDSHNAEKGSGYVVAHLTPSGKSKMDAQEIRITSYSPHRSPDDLRGIRINGATRGPWDAFLFAILLAFLALPAITSVSFGEESVSLHEISWPRRFCRSGFLAAKIALSVSASPLRFAGSLVRAFPVQCEPGALHPNGRDIFRMPVRHELGAERSTPSLPGVFAARGASGACRPAFKNISSVEWNRAYVHGRPHAAACSFASDQLVRQSTLDVSRPLVEVSFCGSGSGLSRCISGSACRPRPTPAGMRR